MLINIHPGRYLHYTKVEDIGITDTGDLLIEATSDAWTFPKEKFGEETVQQAVERIAGAVNSLHEWDRTSK